ncbi:hypothetical protein Tco_0361570 [Tanacetum coccineum]
MTACHVAAANEWLLIAGTRYEVRSRKQSLESSRRRRGSLPLEDPAVYSMAVTRTKMPLQLDGYKTDAADGAEFIWCVSF